MKHRVIWPVRRTEMDYCRRHYSKLDWIELTTFYSLYYPIQLIADICKYNRIDRGENVKFVATRKANINGQMAKRRQQVDTIQYKK